MICRLTWGTGNHKSPTQSHQTSAPGSHRTCTSTGHTTWKKKNILAKVIMHQYVITWGRVSHWKIISVGGVNHYKPKTGRRDRRSWSVRSFRTSWTWLFQHHLWRSCRQRKQDSTWTQNKHSRSSLNIITTRTKYLGESKRANSTTQILTNNVYLNIKSRPLGLQLTMIFILN